MIILAIRSGRRLNSNGKSVIIKCWVLHSVLIGYVDLPVMTMKSGERTEVVELIKRFLVLQYSSRGLGIRSLGIVLMNPAWRQREPEIARATQIIMAELPVLQDELL